MMAMRLRSLALAGALLVALTGTAVADPVPVPIPSSVPPQILNNPIVQSLMDAVGNVLLQTTNGNTAHGKVTYFKRFDLQVETAPNVYRNVHLHQGTVINPRGTTLAPGMTVDVSGVTEADHSLDADVITAH